MAKQPPAPPPRRPRLRVHPALLAGQAHDFSDRAARLQEVLDSSQEPLAQLKSTGLGWDRSSLPFSLPFWVQQDKVLGALRDTVTVFHEVSLGLTAVSRRLAAADEEVANKFRHLHLAPAIDPVAGVDYSRLRPGRAQ